MPKHEYTATATRDGKWWVVEVDGMGATQGRSVTEARTMANDLVAAMLNVPIIDVDVSVMFQVEGVLGKEVEQAREATYAAELAQAEAAESFREVVANVKASGLSGADISAVLEVSPQRVSQLSKRAPEKDQERTKKVREWARKRGIRMGRSTLA